MAVTLILTILAIILLIFGAEIFRFLSKFSSLNLIAYAANLVLKTFCILLGIIAGVIFLILQKIIPYVIKYLPMAVTWTISAIVTFALLTYAGGRKIFHGESITDFVKKLIPNKRISQETDFSLLAIEIADAINSDITSKLKQQYKKILKFFNPFN